jgi:hypothetical protein
VDVCGKSNEIRRGHVVPRLEHEEHLLAPCSGSNSYWECGRNWMSVQWLLSDMKCRGNTQK